MLSIPHSSFPSPVARHSPLTCAALPELNRPHLPGSADRVWMLMRKAWVGKWCAAGVLPWLLKYKFYEIMQRNNAKLR